VRSRPDDVAGPPWCDYIGIASKPGFAYPAWADFRNGNADIYMAIVDFPPSMPTCLTGADSSCGTKLTWDANPEDDIDYYEIWRYIYHNKYNQGPWENIGSTSNTVCCDDGFDYNPNGPTKAKYKIRARDHAGQYSPYSAPTPYYRGYEQESKMVSAGTKPSEFSLYPNLPNPFNPETEIQFDLPEAARVTVTVYNVLGQVVDVLMDSMLEGGYHVVHWNGENAASGVYFCRIAASGTSQQSPANFTATRCMVLMK